MRIRQVALVARDLEPVVADLCTILGLEVAFRDPNVRVFGLHNAVMPVGDTFLEVVSPQQANTTAGRYLERRGGDGGYMVIVQCEDLDRERSRIERLGARVAWSVDLPEARSIHLHPRDVGGAILSLDVAMPPESWLWAGPRWRDCVHTEVITAIRGVELQSPEPERLATRWGEVLGRAVVRGDCAWTIQLHDGQLRFVEATDGRGEGVGGIDVALADQQRSAPGARVGGEQVIIGGTRIRFV
jgi:glyoxalase-like protein